ncbi:MAG: HK97 family phage prohead protease [Reyranellaceae bacterium]
MMQWKDASGGDIERAVVGSLSEFKFADATDGNAGTFSGYGAVFNNIDLGGDVIAPGAFKATLDRAKGSGNWPAMLLQHGGGMLGGAEDMTPIGIWTAMSEDAKGLWVEGKLADTQRGRDVYTLLKMQPRPAITGLSIGYQAKEWSVRTQPHEPKRTLKAVELFEVSLVTNPMNPVARIDSVKSGMELLREFERFATRDAGMSRSEFRRFMAPGLKAFLATRDAGAGNGRELVDSLEGLADRIRNLTA